MELNNDRQYPVRDVEEWLADYAGLRPGTSQWKKVLRGAADVTVGDDVFLFQRVSDAHYRVHRANAEQVKQVFGILDEATAARTTGCRSLVDVVLLGVLLLVFVGVVVDVVFR
ncbi:hypothetical protein [Burkholderia vietnamiensis]|uniref:hypothetical protein n=1 Tax=Burkholderia vietnamiensis TaxID=60552 RepID=UPI000A99B019|nr:hypothetical protein [Burkholderia vietnamiensis]MBR8189122.1 hypothetical protein [Burkholderia vietnamiensis]